MTHTINQKNRWLLLFDDLGNIALHVKIAFLLQCYLDAVLYLRVIVSSMDLNKPAPCEKRIKAWNNGLVTYVKLGLINLNCINSLKQYQILMR